MARVPLIPALGVAMLFLSAVGALPAEVVVEGNTTLTGELNGSLAVTFANPEAVLTFQGVVGEGNITVNGSGTIIFLSSSISTNGTFLTYYGEGNSSLAVVLEDSTIVSHPLAEGNAEDAPPVVVAYGPISLEMLSSYATLSARGTAFSRIALQSSHLRTAGTVWVENLRAERSTLEGILEERSLPFNNSEPYYITNARIVVGGEMVVEDSNISYFYSLPARVAVLLNTTVNNTEMVVEENGEITNTFFLREPGVGLSYPITAVTAVKRLRVEGSTFKGWNQGVSAPYAPGPMPHITIARSTFLIPSMGVGVRLSGALNLTNNTFTAVGGENSSSPVVGTVGVSYQGSVGKIEGNTFANLEKGVEAVQEVSICTFGFPKRCLATTSNVDICNNAFTNNYLALHLLEAHTGEICNNTFEGNNVSMLLWDPLWMEVKGNTITRGDVGVAFSSKDGEGVVRFTSNTFQGLRTAYGPTVIYTDGSPSKYVSVGNTFEDVEEVAAIYYTKAVSFGGGPIFIFSPQIPLGRASQPRGVGRGVEVLLSPPMSPLLVATYNDALTPIPDDSVGDDIILPIKPRSLPDPMELALEDLSAMEGSNMNLEYILPPSTGEVPAEEEEVSGVKEMELVEDTVYLPDLLAMANDTSNGTFYLKLNNTLVHGPHSGIALTYGTFDATRLFDVVRGEGDNGTIYLGRRVISIDTEREPHLKGLNATLYFKVPSCRYRYRVWASNGVASTLGEVKAEGRIITSTPRCTYSERLSSWVVEVPITIR